MPETPQDTIFRQIYGRLFRGTHDQIADTGAWGQLRALFDRTYMPSLVISKGKQAYYSFSVAANTTQSVTLPPAYDSAEMLYIAIRANLPSKVSVTSPVHGSSKVTLLAGTDSTSDGDHGAYWTYQGRVTSLSVIVPASPTGATTDFQVFMYEIPDLEDFESYYDKQIGLGVQGVTP